MAISKKPFGVMPDGREVTQYTLTNARGASVSVINFGGILTNVRAPDRNGVLDDVVLGFGTRQAIWPNMAAWATRLAVMATVSHRRALRLTA